MKNLHFCKKISPGIVLICAVQSRGYPVGFFVLMLLPPFSSAVATHRSHSACFHFAREVGQKQRNTSVFKAFRPCSYYNLIVYPSDNSGCFHGNLSPYITNCNAIICNSKKITLPSQISPQRACVIGLPGIDNNAFFSCSTLFFLTFCGV